MRRRRPRPAATILLLRRGGKHGQHGVEVLMVRRSTTASFMPGVWVFPGGIDRAGRDTGRRARRASSPRRPGSSSATEAELVAWSRWITPEVVPVRFDTHFFVALAGPHATAEADGVEVSDAGWFEPRAALDAHAAGELELVFPTIKTLETLLDHETADAVIEAARTARSSRSCPGCRAPASDHRVLLPWDDGYEDAASDLDSLPP